MKKLFLFAALFVTAAFSSCSKHDNEINDVEPPVPPETTPLVIAFAEGNSLQFNVGETKTVHYTITGGSDNTVVKAEMQTSDDAYSVETTPISATEGTITITATMPTNNCVLVTVSDGSQTVTAEIAVSTNSIPEELAITFAEGNSLEFSIDETKIVHYTITGGSENTVVNAELQTPDDAYTVETTSTLAAEGTIAITAKTPETDNCVVVTVSDGDQSITAEIAVSTNSIPEELAIAFAEGNSLEFNVGETKTVHYTITGGSDKTVVKAEMQKSADAYAIETTPTSATEGTITITAKTPLTENRIIVTVSDGSQTVTAEIAVALKASFDGKTAVVETPGTLSQLLVDYDKTKITELTVIGNLNDEDIAALKNLPNLAVIDMENANLEVLPAEAFNNNKSLTSVKLPQTLKTIGDYAFYYCSGLTSITIPNSVTSIGKYAFYRCSSLTSITIPDSVTSIGDCAFQGCSNLTAFYGKFASSDNRCLIVDGELIAFAPAGLTSYTIPNSVKLIGNNAFYSCKGLTNVTVPDSITSIEGYAFSACSNLTSITIPDSVTSIGDCAFSGCSGLTSVTIGNGVMLIEDYAFNGCIGLTRIYCKAQTPPTIEGGTFYGIVAWVRLYVPVGCTDAYRTAKYWSKFANINEMEFE